MAQWRCDLNKRFAAELICWTNLEALYQISPQHPIHPPAPVAFPLLFLGAPESLGSESPHPRLLRWKLQLRGLSL